jgi:hypothetical protein
LPGRGGAEGAGGWPLSAGKIIIQTLDVILSEIGASLDFDET